MPIAVKPAVERISATFCRSPKAKGPGAFGSAGAGCTMSRIAAIGSRTQSFSCAPRQHTKASRPPGFNARRICVKAATGSSKNITPKREKRRSKCPAGSGAVAASALRNSTGMPAGVAVRAISTSCSDMSTPRTYPPAPTRSASGKVEVPDPQPISRICSPGRASAAAIAALPKSSSITSSRARFAAQRLPLSPFQSCVGAVSTSAMRLLLYCELFSTTPVSGRAQGSSE